ncbi:hypothetical protein LSTR_LSTR006034 [Laodelphax striatellus]|uniref:Uncharacterized protein n=1 Tax=Laodelphax striatellus TaxID=195883 RepID=A0A482XQK8_LAOST|nr:hypothetical protein LSTR_LSTR006034 [Laodelphax striatellus]
MDISSILSHMKCQRLLLVSLTVLLVLTQAAEESASPQERTQMWRETEADVNLGGADIDSYPAESQDTNTQRQSHPNSAPLQVGDGEEVEERPWRPRNRTRNGNGKRRRRMRKRPRTTTPTPDQEGPAEEEGIVYKPRYNERIRGDEVPAVPGVEEEVVYPRRRPNKRRRRPVKRPVEDVEVVGSEGQENGGIKVEEVEREIFRSRPGSHFSEPEGSNKSLQETDVGEHNTRNFYRTRPDNYRVRSGAPRDRHQEPEVYRSRTENNNNGQRKRRKGQGRKRIRVEEVKIETTTVVPSFSEEMAKVVPSFSEEMVKVVPSFSEEMAKEVDENKEMVNRNEESRYSTLIVTSKVESTDPMDEYNMKDDSSNEEEAQVAATNPYTPETTHMTTSSEEGVTYTSQIPTRFTTDLDEETMKFTDVTTGKYSPEVDSTSTIVDDNHDTITTGLPRDEDNSVETTSFSTETTVPELKYTTAFTTYDDAEKTTKEVDPMITSLGTTQTPRTPVRYSSRMKYHSRVQSSSPQISTTTEYIGNRITTESSTTKEPTKAKLNRKKLFSNSRRRLPPTSAIIRRRLKKKENETADDKNEDELLIKMKTPVHINTEKELKVKYHTVTQKTDTKNEIDTSTLMPVGYKAVPEIISPMKLLEEVTIGEVLKMMSTTGTTISPRDEASSESYTRETPKVLEGVTLPNIRDEILDLIRSDESGYTRLKRILELRNMTLTDLLEHRERGSSQLHFSEAFRTSTPTTTTETTTIKKVQYTTENIEATTKNVQDTTRKVTTKNIEATTKHVQDTMRKVTTEKVTTMKEPSPEPEPTPEEMMNDANSKAEIELEKEIESQRGVESRKEIDFDQKQDESKYNLIMRTVEASVIPIPINNDKTNNPHIQFPEQGVLKTFPTFLTDTIRKDKGGYKEEVGEERINNRPVLKEPSIKFYIDSKRDETREPRRQQFESFRNNQTDKRLNKTSEQTIRPFRGESKELVIAVTSARPKTLVHVDDVLLFNESDEVHRSRTKAVGKISADTESEEEDSRLNDFADLRKFPPGVKSAILASGAVLGIAILGFLTVLVTCRLRQRSARLRAKRDILCEQLQEDFRSSQCSLSPVLNKHQRVPVFSSRGIHSNTSSNRHYYLWRTLRKTFQYE